MHLSFNQAQRNSHRMASHRTLPSPADSDGPRGGLPASPCWRTLTHTSSGHGTSIPPPGCSPIIELCHSLTGTPRELQACPAPCNPSPQTLRQWQPPGRLPASQRPFGNHPKALHSANALPHAKSPIPNPPPPKDIHPITGAGSPPSSATLLLRSRVRRKGITSQTFKSSVHHSGTSAQAKGRHPKGPSSVGRFDPHAIPWAHDALDDRE